jgi:C4-type Zn-finger protein
MPRISVVPKDPEKVERPNCPKCGTEFRVSPIVQVAPFETKTIFEHLLCDIASNINAESNE